MLVQEKFWKNTEIGKAIYAFPGEVGQLLQETNPASLIRAETFLPFILWRWYFLKQEQEPITPYMKIDFYRQEEHWPKDGQFLPISSFTYKDGKVDLGITLDYISFDEQPLLQDVRNILANKPYSFHFGSTYNDHIANMVKNLSTQKLDFYNLINQYFKKQLLDWYLSLPLLKDVFKSYGNWILFWKGIFQKIENMDKTLYYDTSPLLDEYIFRMRKIYPNFGYLNEELHKKNKENNRLLEAASFWTSLNLYLIIPFSLYLNFFAPTFTVRKNFFEDVEEILHNYYVDPIPLFSPCTFLSLTPFGKLMLRKIWH